MVKATDVVCKYNEGEFAVKHKKDGFKAGFCWGFYRLTKYQSENTPQDRGSYYSWLAQNSRLLCSLFTRRRLGRIFAIAQMRTTAKHSFAAYSLEDSLQTKKNRQNLFFFVCQGISKKIPFSFYQQKRTYSLKPYTVYHIILAGVN